MHEIKLWDNMPKRNKYILGVTSLWMMIPIINTNISYLSGLLGAVCAASTLFWFDPHQNSLLHKADKYLSTNFTITLFIYTIFDIINNNSSILLFSSLSGTTCMFYIISYNYFESEMHNYQLIAHLLFRYSIFLWSYMIMVQSKNIQNEILVVTIGYSINVSVMIFLKSWKNYSYWNNCIATSLLVMGTDLIKLYKS
uniref:Uncharacterized protein n=1 Tax=viral metagenome TaxID=1070528 RepID=A0A6C0CDQ9_9ZZZZ